MSLTFNLSGFQKLFPNASVLADQIKYQVEDSEYRVYNPTWNGNNTQLTMKIDHIRGMATDDHAKLVLEFNPDGSLKQVSGDWDAGGDGIQIPPIVIGAVDAAAGVFMVSTGPETLGVSVVAVAVAAGAFDMVCLLFNYLSPKLLKLSDDGGRLYTLAVVCHAANRACTSVSA